MTNEFRQALEILQGQGYDLLYIVLNISSTVIGVFLVGILIVGFIQLEFLPTVVNNEDSQSNS